MLQRHKISQYACLFRKASLSIQSKQYKQAEEQLLHAIQRNPSSFASYLNAGFVKHHLGKLADSLQLYETAIYMRPYSAEGYYNRCLLMIETNNLQEALGDIRSGLSCLCVEKFMNQNLSQDQHMHNRKWLQKAIEYSENNMQALKILRILSYKQFADKYRQLIGKYDKSYEVSWQEESVTGQSESKTVSRKYSNSLNEGLFRLNGRGAQFLRNSANVTSLALIDSLLAQYIKLMAQGTIFSQIFPETIQMKQSDLSFANKVFDLQLIPIDQNSNRSNKCENQSSTITPLQQRNMDSLEVPVIPTSQPRLSLQMSPKFRNSFNQSNHSVSSNHHNLCHNGCAKCNRHANNLHPFIINTKENFSNQQFYKLEVKTTEIFQSDSIVHPKTYLIVTHSNGQQYATEVDYSGSHFPKWPTQTLYISFADLNTENSEFQSSPCRIQLWHKDLREDILIGSAHFRPKIGRFKCHLKKKTTTSKRKSTAYIFMHISKAK